MKAWHAEARELRRQGWKLKDIASRFRVQVAAASYACSGVKCPIDHVRTEFLKIRRNTARVHSQKTIDEICAMKGIVSAKQIASQYGFRSKSVVIGIWNRNAK